MSEDHRGENPIRRPTLDEVAEWSIAKIVTRYVVPAMLAVGIYVGTTYVEQNEARHSKAAAYIEQVEKQSIRIQTEITRTLSEVQQSLATQQVVSKAQYESLLQENGRQDRRLDRLEDRVNGPR